MGFEITFKRITLDDHYILVLITVPDDASAQRVAEVLLDQKLAACVNILPAISSLYTWQGKATRDAELLLLVKSRADLFETGIVPAVKAVHPYDVPEIIALPIQMGSQSYLDWIGQETRHS